MAYAQINFNRLTTRKFTQFSDKVNQLLCVAMPSNGLGEGRCEAETWDIYDRLTA
jgi:hypothetical protein